MGCGAMLLDDGYPLFLTVLILENETIMLSQNIVHRLLTDAALHPRGIDTSGLHIHFLMK
jgi:hypothetical protein